MRRSRIRSLVILLGVFGLECRSADLHNLRRFSLDSSIIGFAWSPDGQKIATESNYGRNITIWSADGKRERDLIRHLRNGPYVGNSLVLLSGGTLLLTPPENEIGETENRIFSVWDIARGTIVKDVNGPFPAKNFRFNEARIFTVSRDESKVAVISSALLNQPVTVYRTRDWSTLKQFAVSDSPGASGTATAVAFAPDGGQLAIGTLDGRVELYDLSENAPPKILRAYDGRDLIPIAAVAFSPNGKFLAAGAGLTLDAYRSLPSLKLWRLSDRNLVGSFLPSAMPVRKISWNHEGTVIAVGAGDRSVRLGSPDGRPNETWQTIKFSAPVMSIDFAPNSDQLGVASGATLTIFSSSGQSLLRKPQ